MKSRRDRILVAMPYLLATSFVFLLLMVTAGASTRSFPIPLLRWNTSKVDSDTTDGYRTTSIAIDDSGKVHMGYVSNLELWYATLDGTTWTREMVDPGASVRLHSLAVDDTGKPHMTYVALKPDLLTGELRYATVDATGWTTETVDDDPLINGWYETARMSIAVDGSQAPHISYVVSANLKHAVLGAAGWSITVAATHVDGTRRSALDVTPSGVPHIAHYEISSPGYGGILRYVTLNGTQWVSQTVDEYPLIDGMYFGLPSTLRLDSQQNPHILYYDHPNERLKYARWSGTGWISETIPSPMHSDWFGSMALDADDNPHISFTGPRGRNLIYAVLTDTQWIFQTIDDADGAGHDTGIDLYGDEDIYVSYQNESTQEVRVAHSWYARHTLYLPLTFKQ